MTFMGVYPEKKVRPRWVAIFKTSIGFNHVPLPMSAIHTPKGEAEEYARRECG